MDTPNTLLSLFLSGQDRRRVNDDSSSILSRVRLPSLQHHGRHKPDKQVATMIFSNFVVDKDGRFEKYQKQKFCRVTFSILTSPLFSSAGFNLRTEENFDVERGARAGRENFYYSESRPQESVLDTLIETGYKSDDYRLESNSTMVGKDLSICNKYNQTVSGK